MSDIETHLEPGEALVWQGAPGGKPIYSGAIGLVRVVGWIMAVIFAFFLVIGLANRDEMGGAMGIWIAFLVLSGGLWLAFVFVLPTWARRNIARTRYGVTGQQALILRGGRVLDRYDLGKDARIERRAQKGGGVSVLFIFPMMRMQGIGDGARAPVRGRPSGFLGLSEPEAADAEAALVAIRGKGTQ